MPSSTGWDQIARNLEKYANLGWRRFARSAAKSIVQDIKSTMMIRYEGIASPPGGPPYWRTADLRKSVQSTISWSTKTIYVYADMRYAAYVEFGTSRMKPRPYLRGGLLRYVTTKLGDQIEASYGSVRDPGF